MGHTMRRIWRFRRLVFFGFLLTFMSGFGQSFFISLFIPSFLETHNISSATFASIYAFATLVGGFLLPWAGRKLDDIEVALYTKVIISGMITAAFLSAFSTTVITLSLAIFMLRFFGQGLLGHISDTVIAKRFSANRGKALSMSALGYPISEAILPLLAVFALGAVGLQKTWIIIACFLILILGVVTFLANAPGETENEHHSTQNPLAEFKGIRSLKFWFWATGNLMPAFLLTGLFLYHGVIANLRQWSLELMATSFVAFAIARFTFSIVGGPLVDRFGAKSIYPWNLVPLALGIAVFANVEQSFAPAIYLALAGMSVGLGAPVKTALWAELYGTKQLARVRSTLASLSVIGTAAGPPILVALLDSGLSLNFALSILSITLGVIIIITAIFKPLMK